MDVSPSRNTNVRKDNFKSVPKLSGEQFFKQKVENTMDEIIEQKTVMSKGINHTKIPLKRTPTSNLVTKSSINQRNFNRKPMKSVSKTSLTTRDMNSKKLEPNSSKQSFKSQATSKNAKSTVQLGKSLTARGSSAVNRRSVSTISYRSLRSPKNDDNNSIYTLSKLTTNTGDHDTHNLSARERVVENNKIKVFETMQKKLQEMQSDFMQKFENLKLICPEKLKCDFKFISMIKNDECKLLVKEDDVLRLPKKLPVESVNEFKEKIRNAMDSCLMTLLDNLRLAQESSSEYERSLSLEETHNKLEREQAFRLNELNNTINVLCSVKNNEADSQIVKMQREIQEGKKASQVAEKKYTDLKSSHALELIAIEKRMKEKYDAEIIKKDSHISELQKKYKNIEKQYEKLCCSVQQNVEENSGDQLEKIRLMDEMKSCKDNMQNLLKKLAHSEQHLNHEKKEKHEKLETIKKLESELEESKKRIEDISFKHKSEITFLLKDKQKEIVHLKYVLESSENEKRDLLEQVKNLKVENNCIHEIRSKLHDAEDRIGELQSTIEESERLTNDPASISPEIRNELETLRLTDAEKRREIEKLKVELSKAHFNICQLEEQIQRDQQLLEVRSELINSLQTNDNSQRIHLEEMFAQVGEKNNTINEVGLNNELRTKSEEFRNLFITLSTKQMELTRQEHMIKLLEESNERSQMLRVKQEEKIGRMEEEIAQLKQTIGIYQTNVLGNAGCKNLLFTPVSSGDEYNENFYYYTSERRRKRQVDINVKKYET